MFLETNGLRGDMIKRAKEQQQRMSEYLDKKSIICPFFCHVDIF